VNEDTESNNMRMYLFIAALTVIAGVIIACGCYCHRRKGLIMKSVLKHEAQRQYDRHATQH